MLDAQIFKRRREFTVDVALRVPAGSSLALFGASGAGKSTVLSCIAGIEEPDRGFVRIGEQNLFPPSQPLHSRPIGYMTQETNLFPHLRVDENVRFSMNGHQDDEWIAELRDRLDLGPIWNAPAARVSGGQARRVALARMLVRRPTLVLLDEPFSGLDRHIVRGLLDDILKWQTQLGFGLIVVDHQVQILERLCTKVAVLESGQVVQNGTWPELRRAPATQLLAHLLEPL